MLPKNERYWKSVINDINRTASDAHPLTSKRFSSGKPMPGLGSEEDALKLSSTSKSVMTTTFSWGSCGAVSVPRRPVPESGTEEEFNRALSRWEGSPERLQIMFYFKNAGIPPSELDPEQLAKVRRVQGKNLGSGQGVYQ